MKTCPYCGEEIQNIAKKCRYCGEWFNDKKNDELKESNEANELKGKKKKSHKSSILSVIGVILVIIICYIVLYLLNKKETWQAFYYPGELSEGTEISGPIFDNFEACQDWALSKFLDGKEAYCSKNCHDSKGGMPICEDVIRTWHPLPGFGVTFSGTDEIRETLEQKAYEEELKRQEEKKAEFERRKQAYWECRDSANRPLSNYLAMNYGCNEINNCEVSPRTQAEVDELLEITNKTTELVTKCNNDYPDIPRQR